MSVSMSFLNCANCCLDSSILYFCWHFWNFLESRHYLINDYKPFGIYHMLAFVCDPAFTGSFTLNVVFWTCRFCVRCIAVPWDVYWKSFVGEAVNCLHCQCFMYVWCSLIMYRWHFETTVHNSSFAMAEPFFGRFVHWCSSLACFS